MFNNQTLVNFDVLITNSKKGPTIDKSTTNLPKIKIYVCLTVVDHRVRKSSLQESLVVSVCPRYLDKEHFSLGSKSLNGLP